MDWGLNRSERELESGYVYSEEQCKVCVLDLLLLSSGGLRLQSFEFAASESRNAILLVGRPIRQSAAPALRAQTSGTRFPGYPHSIRTRSAAEGLLCLPIGKHQDGIHDAAGQSRTRVAPQFLHYGSSARGMEAQGTISLQPFDADIRKTGKELRDADQGRAYLYLRGNIRSSGEHELK